MDHRKSLLVIAGAVLMTGAAVHARAMVPDACFTGAHKCSEGIFNGTCVGTLYNTAENPYCACQLNGGGQPFGTWACSPYGAQ